MMFSANLPASLPDAKGNVAVGCPFGLQNLFRGSNGIRIVIERFRIDADNLAALSLDGLVQLVQIPSSATHGLQPLNQKFTTVNALSANKLLSTALPSRSLPSKGRERIAGEAVVPSSGRKCLQLILQLADLGGIVGQRLVVLVRELVLTFLIARSSTSA